MTDAEFEDQMGRLFEAFGDKGFTKGRLKRIADIMAHRPLLVMKTIVDRFIDEKRYAPLPNDFWEIVRIQPAAPVINPEDCDQCEDGLIIAVKKDGTGGRVGFRCPSCDAGGTQPPAMALWSPRWEEDYEKGWELKPDLTPADTDEA